MPGPITCADLARQLPRLHEQHAALDEALPELPRHSPRWRAERAAYDACDRRLAAVEALVLETPAVTLADAAAQLVMVLHKLNCARHFQNGGAGLDLAEPALLSALAVVAQAAGVSPDEFALGEYTALKTPPPVLLAA